MPGVSSRGSVSRPASSIPGASATARVNEHNGWVPRDFWLQEWEKQAILEFHQENPLEGYRRLASSVSSTGTSAEILPVMICPLLWRRTVSQVKSMPLFLIAFWSFSSR